MKVSELIAKLQACNPEALVVVDGYEDGFDDQVEIQSREIKRNLFSDKTWYGRHGPVKDGQVGEPAVRIFGKRRYG